MKTINFINSLKPQQQRALRRWTFFSHTLIGTCIAVIVGIQGKQLYAFYVAKTEHATLAQQVDVAQVKLGSYNQLNERKHALNKQNQKIESIQNHMRATHALLESLHTFCREAIHLQSCIINKKNIELTVLCSDARQAIQYVQELNGTEQLRDVTLISLHHAQDNTNVLATIQGKRGAQPHST